MIVSCPACSARMRLDPERISGKKVKIRCARCQEVFTAVGEAAPPRRKETPATGKPAIAMTVVVAHSDPALCATVADLLEREGITPCICHDGNAALAQLERHRPRVALMDVALPGLYGFEVVEKVRQRPGLGQVKIILLSSVYNRTAYKRTPSSLYGADDYIEKHHLARDLIGKIRRLTGGADSAAAAVPGNQEFSAEVNDRLQRAEESEVSAAAAPEAVEKARRLARIIVSDIALYNQEKIDQGVRKGNLLDLLDFEISEGKRLFQERIPESVRKSEDFLASALNSFIESRRREILG